MPDDTERETNAVAERSPDAPRRRSRTAAAGREFLGAVGGDLATLGRRLRRSLSIARLRWSLRAGRRRLTRTPRPALFAPRSARSSWVGAGGQVLRQFVVVVAILGFGGFLAFAAAMLWALNGLALDRPTGAPDQPSYLIEAANGEALGRVGPLRAADTPLDEYPEILLQAVVSIEDRRFYQHPGVDPLGILRAAHRNAEAGGIEEGGSTITQQLVKMRYVGDDRTYIRKMREALTAVWLETHLSKNEILTRYLNSVYLGAGAYGMAAAARLYFDKRPADLSLAEAAMLAGLIKAPSQFNPLSHLDAAQTRAATVLDAMAENGVITAKDADAAKAAPATVKLSPKLAPARSWFADWIGTQAPAVTGAHKNTMRLRTTLRPDLQQIAQDILDEALSSQGRRLGVSQGALVAMRPDGAVLAMVGGRDYGESQFNRALANRQPGSAFKLFVFLTALRQGYSPQDTIDARSIDIRGWEPENYGNAHYGRMSLAEAFARSVNTAAVRLAMQVGLDRVIATARDLGIETPLHPTPSLALGAYGVTLLDLTGAFAAVRADRMPVKPWGVSAFGQPEASLQATQPPSSGKTLDPYQRPMIDLLRGVVVAGTGRAAELPGFSAGKTGTSQDYRDAWFVGFNDSLVVGVWIGNDDNSPMRHVTGGSLPAAIWKLFVTRATPLVGEQSAPVAAAPAPGETATPQADSTAAQSHEDQASGGNASNQNASNQTAPGQPSAAQAGAGLCDPQACGRVYRSFRASDCTYQPYTGGPRRICELGARSPSTLARTSPETTGAGAFSSPAQCNVEACARSYSSFDPSDCTYQPFGRAVRQACER